MEGNLTKSDFVIRLINEPDETRKVVSGRSGRFIMIIQLESGRLKIAEKERVSDTGIIHGFRGCT